MKQKLDQNIELNITLKLCFMFSELTTNDFPNTAYLYYAYS